MRQLALAFCMEHVPLPLAHQHKSHTQETHRYTVTTKQFLLGMGGNQLAVSAQAAAERYGTPRRREPRHSACAFEIVTGYQNIPDCEMHT